MEYIFNQIIDNYFLIPFIGAVMGVILTALMSKSSQPSVPIQVAKQYYIEKMVIINEKTNNRKSSNDILGETIAILAAAVFVVWLYAKYSNQFLFFSLLTTFSVWIFSFIVTVSTFIKQRFFSFEWWISILFPFVFLSFCLFLQKVAINQVSSEITELANENNPWNFTASLTWYGRYFYLTQLLGIFLCILLMFLCFSGNLHFIALTNFNSSERKIWLLLLNTFKFGARKNIWVLYLIIAVLSYFLLDGTIAELMEKHFANGK